jgi:hypothetical protein
MYRWFYVVALFCVVPAWAQDWSIRIEPLFGFEHVSNRYPEPARFTTRSFFGLRAVAGYPLLAAEFEVTQSNGRRDYPSENLKAEDEVRRGLIGVRSTYAVASFLGFHLRAGARATDQKTTITNTTTNTKEVKHPGLEWDPYAGTGLQLVVANNLALNAGATWFFPKNSPAEVQYSLGITVKFGQLR